VNAAPRAPASRRQRPVVVALLVSLAALLLAALAAVR
jgi:hypothetical protein